MASILLSTEVLKEIIRRCPTWRGPGQIDKEGAIVVKYSPMRRKNSLKKERGLLQNTIILEQDHCSRNCFRVTCVMDARLNPIGIKFEIRRQSYSRGYKRELEMKEEGE